MCERSLILNVCLLIALVSTSPIPEETDVQSYPGIYCDQSAFRNSLIGLFNGEQTSDNTINNIASICLNHQEKDILTKIIYDRVINNPMLVNIINDIQRNHNANNLNDIQNSKNTPHIVNNYIIIPDLNGQVSNMKEDIYTECMLNSPNICTRVKKNADKNQDVLGENITPEHADVNVTKGGENPPYINNNEYMSDNQTTSAPERNTRKRSKRPSKAKSESKPDKLDIQNKDSVDLLVTENEYQRENKTKKFKIKTTNKSTPSKDKSKKSESFNNVGYSHKGEKKDEKTVISQQSTKSIKATSSRLRHDDLVNGKQTKTLPDGGQKKKSKEIQSNKDDSKNKQKVSDTSRSRNTFNSVPIHQEYQFPYDSNSMYKYINSIMSNYQMSNSDYKNDYPFNFNNFYQLPQQSISRSSKKSSRRKSYKRRKNPKIYRRKQNRKRVYSRRKPIDKKVVSESVDEINPDLNNLLITTPTYSLEIKESPHAAIIKKENQTIILVENVSEQNNNISSEENIVTSIFDELSFINNSLPEETYNSYPSFIVGMDDKVPIIFENSVMDDYYPDFTADEALQLTTEEKTPLKYHGDKYHYVSNKNFNFGDFIKKRKRIALKNMSKNSNLLFSESKGTKDTSNQEEKGDEEKMTQFKSPHVLDNPDFRTRKIDSNEIYEPYHHHNIYQDPEEDYNKYDIEDTAVVYSTPMSAKNNVRSKSCNDIEDGLAKWRKMKDSNVETVYARSKLAKYGLSL